MKSRFIFYAVNVHCGGGLTLLQELLDQIPEQAHLFVDSRLPLSDEAKARFKVYRIRPTVYHRFQAEVELRKIAEEGDTVLCFGNLPPLFALKAKVLLFMQNRYLVESNNVYQMSYKLRLKLTLESLWFKFFQKHVDAVIVQTASMSSLVERWVAAPVIIAPFVVKSKKKSAIPKQNNIEKKYDFIYVASGEPHKNHRNLLLAWKRLAEEGLFPSLCLTVDDIQFPELATLIDNYKLQYSLCIENLGMLEHSDVLSMYRQSKVLVFPSTMESFGLPLIEAKSENLKIVASELDYVRDILDPDESFDPQSAVSIMRSVKRYLKVSDKKHDLLSAGEFLTVLKNIE